MAAHANRARRVTVTAPPFTQNPMVLTVELKNGDVPEHTEAAFCFDDAGLEHLISALSALREKRGHTHLTTPAWAGND